MLPMYNTKLFNEIFDDAESFKDNYDTFQAAAGLTNKLDDTDIAITFQLLSAQYGNTPIANLSESQFRIKIWQIMFEYGPSWVKRLDIQQALRDASIADLREGQKYITNTALNPDQAPSTEETSYINQQNVSKSKTSLLGTYSNLLELIKFDVTKEYVDRFAPLFLKIVIPRTNLYYQNEEESE